MSDERVPAYVPDKEELRSKLSLDYVCPHLGVQLDREGRARCPFHDDRDPSFYLWDGDDGVQRWHCHPCGFGGDVFDFIQRMEGIPFPAALVRAAEMLADFPPDYQPPRRERAIRVSPDSWQREVQDARDRAQRQEYAQGYLAVRSGLAALNDDPSVLQRWDAFLRGTYGWGVGHNGAVYMPHWTPDGRLTGCKVRMLDGKKVSLPGSQYESLYGSWLGRRYQAALLTEGETDTVFAAWLAAEEGVPVDVLGLPSGANRSVDPPLLNFLRGARPVYLAFDPDDAGVDATRRWIVSLNDAGFTDVRVCCLPLGRDLRDARPSLRTLLRDARKPLLYGGMLQEAPGGYLWTDRSGNLVPVTSWTVTPTAQLSGDGDAGFDAVLRSQGHERRTVVRLSDLASTQTLNKWANAHGEIFTGSDAQRADIAELVKVLGVTTPEVFQTDRVGMHDPPARYHFAGPSLVLPDHYYGQIPFRYAPSPRAANVTGRLYLPADDQAFDFRLLDAFLALSSPSVTQPLLAWLVAAARRPEVQQFPILFVGGSSGVGKSTLARLAMRLVGSNMEIDLGAVTPFILYRSLAASTSLPVFVDEWSRLSRADTREAFQGVVPLLYTGGLAERGTADLSAQGYRMTSPTIVAGEDTFTLDRELERTVCLYPTRASQGHDALRAVADRPLERFGRDLHTWLTHAATLPDMPRVTDDRVEYNRRILLAGWETLREFLDFMAHLNYVVPDVPALPNLSCFEQADNESRELDENVYVTALHLGMSMSDSSGAPVVWPDPQGRGTWLRAETLIGLLETRRVDVQLPGRSRAMRAYFVERYGELQAHTLVPPLATRQVRAHLIPDLVLQAEEVQE